MAFLGGVLAIPFAIFYLITEPPETIGWIFVIGTILLHIGYFFTLGRAYKHGDLSIVYPIARGLGLALIPVIGVFVLHEAVSGIAVFGISAIFFGVIVVGASSSDGLKLWLHPRNLVADRGVAFAVAALENHEVDRIILCRPAVEAGERLGFLPGDMKDKIDPYLRPLYDSLYDLLDYDKIQRKIESGAIEIAPLAFMRGRTLKNSFAILDEAQNATETQVKMFLTRIGENSKLVVNGDPSQVDLPNKNQSGLIKSYNLLKNIKEIAVINFDHKDVMRDPLVTKIIEAYQKNTNDKG